jgi:mono/diheme cytochrome c family protein
MRRAIPTVFALAWLAACGKEAPPPEPASGPSRQDSLAMAAQAFDSTAFDTVTWNAPEEALSRGGLVFRTSCNKCHGVTGNGDGDLVAKGKSAAPPNFLAPDWKYASDPMGLRRAIFSGGTNTMPYWGLVGLKYRDLDAVAMYITDYLRPTFAEPPGA